MTAPVGSTPEDRNKVRQFGVAAVLLELVATRYGKPGYEAAAAEFERTHRSADVISGLILIAEHFGLTVAEDPGHYLPMLSAWQRMAEMSEALTPVVEDLPPDS